MPLKLEWDANEVTSHETWVVLGSSDSKQKPAVMRFDSKNQVSFEKKPPFNSVQIDRFRARRRGIVTSIIKWLVATTIVGAIVFSALAVLLGAFQLRTVVTGSMSGTFEVGDVLIVANKAMVKPELDSIVVFKYYNLDRSEIVGEFAHRIIGGSFENGWKTKGDSNQEAELTPIYSSDVAGTVVGWIPGLGYYMNPQLLLGVGVIVTVLVFGAKELLVVLRK